MVVGLILIAQRIHGNLNFCIASQQLMYYDTHSQARTTVAIREQIRQAEGSAEELAKRFGVSAQTIRKWRQRDSMHDRSHRPHRLQTSLNGSQENLAMCLRQALRLPLDELLILIRQFIQPQMSRSALDRTLRRRGRNRLAALKPQLSRSTNRQGRMVISVLPPSAVGVSSFQSMLLIATDTHTRWTHAALVDDCTVPAIEAFLNQLEATAPFAVTEFLSADGTRYRPRQSAQAQRSRWQAVAQALTDKSPTWEGWHEPTDWVSSGRAPDQSDPLTTIVNILDSNDSEQRVAAVQKLFVQINHHASLPCLNHQSPTALIKT